MKEHDRKNLFSTDHLTSNLGRRSVSGGLTMGVSQIGLLALYTAGIATLARLLSPEDFGLVATIGALMMFLRLFQEAGLSTATIQKEGATQAQVSNLFWINCGLGAAATLSAAASAPAVAWFFRDERLVGITLVLSVTFLVSSATVQHHALLVRQMKFTALAIIEVSAMAFGLTVAVGMALSGYQYWSLIGMQIGTLVWTFLGTVLCTRWKPSFYARHSATRSMVMLGANLTVASILRNASEAVPSVLIGRFVGLDALGIYSRAQAMVTRPLYQLFAPFDRVMIPSLSRLQNDPERYRKVFLRVYSLIALICFPATALLIGLARPIVLIVLGDGWEEVIPIFAALSVSMLYLPLSNSANLLLTTQGRKNEILTIGVAFPLITIVSATAGLPFGIVGVAVSICLFLICVRLPFQFYIVGRRGPVDTATLWSVFLRHLPGTLPVLGGVWLGRHFTPGSPPIAELGVGAVFGVAAAAMVVMAVPSQRREFLNLLDLGRSLTTRRRYQERPAHGEAVS